jgi:hypothetical protein
MNKIKNNLSMLSTFLTGVVGHHYIGKILEYKSEMAESKEMELRAISEKENMEIIQNKLNSIIQKNENLSQNIETLIDKHLPESQLSHVNDLLDLGGKQCKNVREILDKGPDNINLDFYQAAYKAAVACEKANREASESVQKLVESLNGNNCAATNF